MTKYELEAKSLIEAWLKKQKINLIGKIRHIHPRAYVIGHAAPGCLIVAKPWVDSEDHLKDWNQKNILDTIHTFDKTLKIGDWCATGYFTTDGRSETCAVGWKK